MLLSSGGLAFPRSCCSHSPRALSDAVHASSLGNGGWSVSLVAAVEHGLQAVWTACGGDLLTSGESFSKSFGRPASFLPAPSINLAADQFLLLTDDVIGDPSRQSFLRNVLHHLIRSPELLPSEIVEPGAPTTTSCVRGTHADILVQLQCALMVFEGWLAAAATSRLASKLETLCLAFLGQLCRGVIISWTKMTCVGANLVWLRVTFTRVRRLS